jgi:hypothetical protein
MEYNKWISVADRLPEENERVLTYEPSTDGTVCIEICNYVKNYFTGDKLGFIDEQDEQPSQVFPSHWQPLPNPPVIPTPPKQ